MRMAVFALCLAPLTALAAEPSQAFVSLTLRLNRDSSGNGSCLMGSMEPRVTG